MTQIKIEYMDTLHPAIGYRLIHLSVQRGVLEHWNECRDKVLCTVTSQRDENPRKCVSISLRRKKIAFRPTCPDRITRPLPTLYSVSAGCSSPWVNRLKDEHSPHVLPRHSITGATPPLHLCLYGVSQDNFMFISQSFPQDMYVSLLAQGR
jgi:hypothetical protein